MVFKVVKNKDGKFETIDVPESDPHALDKLHKEVRDMIEGNIQFHDDPFKAPTPEIVEEVEEESLPFDPELWMGNYSGGQP
jgi:hypothetical protein